MMSVHPAVTLSTISSAWTARELSTDGAGTHPIGPSASADTVPDHLLRIHDLVEPPLVDVAGLERGLLQGQASSFALCAMAEDLSYPIIGLSAVTSISERPSMSSMR